MHENILNDEKTKEAVGGAGEGIAPQPVAAKVTCKDCGKIWVTPSPDVYDTCPRCKSKNIKVEW